MNQINTGFYLITIFLSLLPLCIAGGHGGVLKVPPGHGWAGSCQPHTSSRFSCLSGSEGVTNAHLYTNLLPPPIWLPENVHRVLAEFAAAKFPRRGRRIVTWHMPAIYGDKCQCVTKTFLGPQLWWFHQPDRKITSGQNKWNMLSLIHIPLFPPFFLSASCFLCQKDFSPLWLSFLLFFFAVATFFKKIGIFAKIKNIYTIFSQRDIRFCWIFLIASSIEVFFYQGNQISYVFFSGYVNGG